MTPAGAAVGGPTPTYDSDSEGSDADTCRSDIADPPVRSPRSDADTSGSDSADSSAQRRRLRGKGREVPHARITLSSAVEGAATCEDYYDVDEDESGPDLLERQVLARKINASAAVSKLVCDEVDKTPEEQTGSAELAPESLGRALSRGRSTGGIRGRTGMARSKSTFGQQGGFARSKSAARSRSTVRGGAGGDRGMDGASTLDEVMRDGGGTRRVTRTRGAEGPARVAAAGDGFGAEGAAHRPSKAELLNAIHGAEDDEREPRKASIRFA